MQEESHNTHHGIVRIYIHQQSASASIFDVEIVGTQQVQTT
jgi:hypothetical protein